MMNFGRIILVTSFLLGVWVLGSFLGVMFDTVNAEFWATSLMWGLLASILVMPALVVIKHALTEASHQQAQAGSRQKASQESVPKSGTQTPFIKESDQEHSLWPQSQDN